jgi:hypothetical protein
MDILSPYERDGMGFAIAIQMPAETGKTPSSSNCDMQIMIDGMRESSEHAVARALKTKNAFA